jgi:hypothetical protein
MYDRESREIRFTESSESNSLRDSLASTENMAAGRNSPRKDSYDTRNDADGGGAQFRQERIYSTYSDGGGKESPNANIYEEDKVDKYAKNDLVEELAQQKLKELAQETSRRRRYQAFIFGIAFALNLFNQLR